MLPGMEWGSWHPARRRLLLHLDIDAFLASVEQLLRPSLLGSPVAVGTGVVASRSYEAKARGVESAMRLSEARRRCPELVVCEGDAQRAARFRERVAAIVAQHIPCVELSSLDDLYADIGEVVARELDGLGAARALAERIRKEVRQETGLSVAQGIGTTRTLARLATTRAKPGGVFLVEPGRERSFLDSVPLCEIPGIGPKTAQELALYRIRSVAELRLVDFELMRASFGKRGEELYWKLRGLPANDKDARVRPQGGVLLGHAGGAWGEGLGAQLSRSSSLWIPSGDPDELRGYMSYLSDRATAALRRQARQAGRLDLHLQLEALPEKALAVGRVPPEFLRRGMALRPPTACRELITARALMLLESMLSKRYRVSKLGLTLSRLRDLPEREQALLFEGALDIGAASPGAASPGAARAGLGGPAARRLDAALDALRAKHGFGSIMAGESIALLGQLAQGRDGFRLRTPSLTL